MDVALLQKEIQELPEDQQDRLAAFLTALRMRRSGFDQEISQRLDDLRAEKWTPWRQIKDDFNKEDPAGE